jgi:hypothetical protein
MARDANVSLNLGPESFQSQWATRTRASVARFLRRRPVEARVGVIAGVSIFWCGATGKWNHDLGELSPFPVGEKVFPVRHVDEFRYRNRAAVNVRCLAEYSVGATDK